MSDVPVPEDVLRKILSRLPVKSLIRFRCVSKTWCALTKKPDFIYLHVNQSIKTNSNTTIIVRQGYSVDPDSLTNPMELDSPLKPYYGIFPNILGSCNGLVCLSRLKTHVLWNPSTRKHIKLPSPGFEFSKGSYSYLYIVYGFGYDHVNHDYKLVRMEQYYGKDVYSLASIVKVYSQKLASWRRITDFPYYLCYNGSHGVFVGGALHWIVCRKLELDSEKFIAAFDLGTEQYGLVPLPEYLDKGVYMHVEVLGETLCLICNFLSIKVDMWVMKDYGVKNSWTKLISVKQPSDLMSFIFLMPVVYSKSREKVLLAQDGGVVMWWYDLKRKTFEKVQVSDKLDFYNRKVCVESLVKLNGGYGRYGKKKEISKKR